MWRTSSCTRREAERAVRVRSMERSTTIPLAVFFCGGTAVLGTIYDALGWPTAMLGIGLALLAAACLTPGSGLAGQPSQNGAGGS